MIKPSEMTIKAINGLVDNGNFKTVLQWFEESAIQQSIKLNHMRGEEVPIMQGRNLEIEDILTHISKATDYSKNVAEAQKMEKKE